jgi:PAS domain S-box-containing protein
MNKNNEPTAPSTGNGSRTETAAADERTKVLVVDDDERNLLAIETVLEPVAEVVRASSGEEALRCLLKQDFAVILLDVFMPGLDGYETARFIRQREQSKRTPIIFLTAINKEDAHMLRGYDMGAVDYVFKPFEPLILKSKVAVFVDLYEKTREITRKAALEQQLMEENLRANAEKLEVEKALRQAEERQALILRSLPLALYEEPLAATGRSPQFVGGDVVGLTGYAAEAFGRDVQWIERVHPDDERFATRTVGVLGHGGAVVSEYRWQCADGRIKHFLDHAVVLRDGAGLPVGVAGTLLDVTERRQLEDRLVQAQKLDAIGKLTGGVAHDLNNLLASVLGGLRLVERRTPLGEDSKAIFDMTRHAAEQGAELIRRMLAFSRRQHLRPDAVHLQNLQENMEGMVAHILGGLVRFEWRLADGLWPAWVDVGQLELALMNLIVNARDAMPDGGTITVSAENRTATSENGLGLSPRDYVVLAVSDTGCGISAENLARVVEPFFTTKDVGKGTGLGLSTSYGFARQSGGTLAIESEEGRGTRVEIWLPRSQVEPELRPVEVPEQDPVAAPAEGGRGVALVVDDVPALRDITALMLADGGFTVMTASGGGEALAILERDPDGIDLIVTDFAMPLVSGLDIVRFARSLRADMPAVIVTGYADTTAIAGRPADVPLLTKPFKEKELMRVVRPLVAARESRRPRR